MEAFRIVDFLWPILSKARHKRLKWWTVKQPIELWTLLDTGASANLVCSRVLAALKLKRQPVEADLRLADNTAAAIVGMVSLRIKLQHFVAESALLCDRRMSRLCCHKFV